MKHSKPVDSSVPRGIEVKVLNALLDDLRKRGIWAERHSYSIRMIYSEALVASLHLYPGFGEAVLRLYGNRESNEYVLSAVRELVTKYLPDFNLKVVFLRHIVPGED